MLVKDNHVYPSIVKPVAKKFPLCGDKDCWVIRISGDEYKICCDPVMWSSSKPGDYGQGIMNSSADPKRVERTSRLGELAFAKVFPGLGVDIEYRKGGDRSDFVIGGKTVDVKTAIENKGVNCIQVVNDRGTRTGLKSDIYIGSFIDIDARYNRVADVVLVGWTWKSNLVELPDVLGRRGNWLNKEMTFSDLKPIELLSRAYRASTA